MNTKVLIAVIGLIGLAALPQQAFANQGGNLAGYAGAYAVEQALGTGCSKAVMEIVMLPQMPWGGLACHHCPALFISRLPPVVVSIAENARRVLLWLRIPVCTRPFYEPIFMKNQKYSKKCMGVFDKDTYSDSVAAKAYFFNGGSR